MIEGMANTEIRKDHTKQRIELTTKKDILIRFLSSRAMESNKFNKNILH